MYPGGRHKVCAIVEARMASTRLPGKVMLPLAGAPALQRLVERLFSSLYIDDIIIATTENSEDSVICDLAKQINVKYFRGEENDIACRLKGAAEDCGADLIVQITGDCPLIDPAHVDKSIEMFEEGGLDYVSNSLTRSFPIGFDVRLFTLDVLKKAIDLTDDPIDRIHGSYFIYRRPDIFRLGGWRADEKLNRPEIRLTLDEYADYKLLKKIFDALYLAKPNFTAEDVIDLLNDQPEWVKINAGVKQKRPDQG